MGCCGPWTTLISSLWCHGVVAANLDIISRYTCMFRCLWNTSQRCMYPRSLFNRSETPQHSTMKL